MMFHRILFSLSFLVILIAEPVCSQDSAKESPKEIKKPKKNRRNKNGGKKSAALNLPVTIPFAELDKPDQHEDFPAMCLNAEGQPIVVYIENDGTRDVLKLASLNVDGELKTNARITKPEITNIYQPSLTRLSSGRLFCVWSQLEADGQWDLMGCTIGRKGKAVMGGLVRISDNPGNDIFPDLGTDRNGRIWAVWQRMKDGVNQLVAKHQETPESKWSDEIIVTTGKGGGDWEPRLAFGNGDEALVVFDSYRNGDFDVYLTKVSADGTVKTPIEIARTDRYEARAEAAASPDGKHLWVTYEDGITHWGKTSVLNGGKRAVVSITIVN